MHVWKTSWKLQRWFCCLLCSKLLLFGLQEETEIIQQTTKLSVTYKWILKSSWQVRLCQWYICTVVHLCQQPSSDSLWGIKIPAQNATALLGFASICPNLCRTLYAQLSPSRDQPSPPSSNELIKGHYKGSLRKWKVFPPSLFSSCFL